jgi:hypothetical protein
MPLRTDPRTGTRVDLPEDVKAEVPKEERTYFLVRGLTSWGVDFIRDVFSSSGAADQIVAGEEVDIQLGRQTLLTMFTREKLFALLKQGLCGWGNFFEITPDGEPDKLHEFKTEVHPVLGPVPTDSTLALLPMSEAAWLAGQVISRASLGQEAVRG